MNDQGVYKTALATLGLLNSRLKATYLLAIHIILLGQMGITCNILGVTLTS